MTVDPARSARVDLTTTTAVQRLVPVAVAGLHDPARVAAVLPYLDRSPDSAEALARLAHLAAELSGARWGQISLLADRQAVVALVSDGVPQDAPLDGPLEEAICSVTAAVESPLVVLDTVEDSRVAGLAAVRSGQVRSYCGVPLHTPDGLVIGALCVFDAEARRFGEREVSLLGVLAASAMREFELQRTNYQLRNAVTRLDRVVSAAQLGGWEWRVGSDRIVWDARMYELFGISPSAFGHRIEDFLAALHPDDRSRTSTALSRAVDEITDYDAEYRVRQSDGTWRWIRAWGRAVAGGDGGCERVVGVATDDTAVRLERDLVARAVDHVTDVVFSLDHDLVMSYANVRTAELLGTTRAAILGRPLVELVPPATYERYVGYLEHTRSTGATSTFEYESEIVDSWWEARIQPTPEGYFVSLHDISARKQIERERAAAMARQRTVAEALQASVLPESLPSLPGVEVAARYRPGDVGVRVGGDWYDCFEADDGHLIITVGDVVGHGLHAASVMGQLRNALRAYALLRKGPARLLMRLDQLLARHEPTGMATVWVGELDLRTRELCWASAGHPPVLRIGAGRTVPLEGRPNPPVGAAPPGQEWREQRVTLDPGDVLVAYTDGLVERRGETILDGIERLRGALDQVGSVAVKTLLDDLDARLLQGRTVDDDVCVFALRMLELPGPADSDESADRCGVIPG